MHTSIDTPVWNADKCKMMWRHYLGDGNAPSSDGVSAYAAPGRALDLSGLPSAYILACEGDPLHVEAIEYALRLMRADVAVELHHYPHTYHGFDLMGLTSSIGQRALHEQFSALAER